MKGPLSLTFKDSDYAVIDGVFDSDSFTKFVHYFNKLDFAYRSLTGWQKVWRLSDGLILSSSPYYASRAPHDSMMDALNVMVGSLAVQYFAPIVGKNGEDWDDYFLTPYIYSSGTKISWHNDLGYTGAAIFYAHEKWDPNWGGELLVAKTNPKKMVSFPDPIDRSGLAPILNEYGLGTYLSPLPNRIVFTKGGIWHSINRVDPVAGDALRCSVVAFFYKRNADAQIQKQT